MAAAVEVPATITGASSAAKGGQLISLESKLIVFGAYTILSYNQWNVVPKVLKSVLSLVENPRLETSSQKGDI